MSAKWISVISGIVGAAIGSILAGVGGAITGALLASLAPIAVESLSNHTRLKKKILKTLSVHGQMQVRDVMKGHGLNVPTDCVSYEPGNTFVKKLASYKAAFEQLEAEQKVVHSKQASVVHGYVDAPNDWINEWAGRTYSRA